MEEGEKARLCRYVALDIHKYFSVVAVVAGWVFERPGWEGLILKRRKVFDGEVFQDIA